MEKKILLGTLASAVTGFILASIIFMGLFGNMAQQWQAEFASCLKEQQVLWWVVGSLVQAFFTTLVLHRMGINSAKAGMITGAWFTFLFMLCWGIFNATTYIPYTWDWMPLDVISNTIIGSICGGVIGWVFSKVK